MTPNQITFLRVALALVAAAFFEINWLTCLLAVVLTVVAVSLDAVDGYVARKRHMQSALGAKVDILGDRIVENVYLVYFASAGVISFWIPVVFIMRGMATDFVRALAAKLGRTGYGKNSLLESGWGRALVASRFSRGLYGILKCFTFCFLGLMVFMDEIPHSFSWSWLTVWMPHLKMIASGFAYLVASACLIRGFPVLWEGRRIIRVLGNAK